MENDGEEVAISWFLRNECTSNVQLSGLSNVCRRWREIAVGAVASEVVASAGLSSGGDEREIRSSKWGESRASSSFYRRLLITDMGRELVCRQHRRQTEHRADAVTTESNANTSEGSFCLAWFAPSGIQATSVPLGETSDEEKAANGEAEARRRKNRRRKGRIATCCTEWRGHRRAWEVLHPFGYSAEFIRRVLDESLARASNIVVSGAKESGAPDAKCPSSPQCEISSHRHDPTFAVRGATLARPEGFCLCVDDDRVDRTRSSDGDRRPPRKNLERKRSVLAKSLLPRVIKSARRKYPLLHRFAETDEDEGAARRHLPWEKRQRAVQFLNSDRSQAVKLITPRFQCGEVRGPVTMFLVAIATEDGCFVSGRATRFELGHLYPLSQRDMQFDSSPISIATGKKDPREEAAHREASGLGSSAGNHAVSTEDCRSGSDSDKSMHCLCKFDSDDPFNPRNDFGITDPGEDCIYRGCTGPGLWHCYVAIFDGKESLIRIDGCNEPRRTQQHYGLATCEGGEDDVENSSSCVGDGVFDGLSIGSDHQFDMSLCYGRSDGECGQGAIAEIAIFKGRMDDSDIKELENQLMAKHGILSVEDKREFVAEQNSSRTKPIDVECHIREDEWRRQAHALIEQRRPWNVEGAVPLRVAANHPSVAWHRVNEITGAPVKVSRIGAKNSNGSSDW